MVSQLGATPTLGTLEDLDGLRRGAEAADAVIHTAFVHDFSNLANGCAIDQRAISTIGDVLAGSNRAFAITTGTPNVPGRVATELDAGDRSNVIFRLRGPAEDLALALAERGVRTIMMRMPRAVHGVGADGWRAGLVGPLLDIARDKGTSAYIGDGLQRWPAVHRLDAARLYRLAIEKAPAGARVHAVQDEGVTLRELAEAISRRLSLPVVATSVDEAAAHFGLFAGAVGLDQPASSARTRELFGWEPREIGLLADLDANVSA